MARYALDHPTQTSLTIPILTARTSIRRPKVPHLPSLHPKPPQTPTDSPPPNSLVGTGNLDKAAIFNTDGNSVWATSAGFTVSPQEMQEVVAAYKDPGKDGVKQVQASGLHIAGERFVVLKADDRSVYGKKVSFADYMYRGDGVDGVEGGREGGSGGTV